MINTSYKNLFEDKFSNRPQFLSEKAIFEFDKYFFFNKMITSMREELTKFFCTSKLGSLMTNHLEEPAIDLPQTETPIKPKCFKKFSH